MKTQSDALSRIEIENSEDNIFAITRSKSNSIQLQNHSNKSFQATKPDTNINIPTVTGNDKINKIIQEFHNNPIGGHQGVMRTFNNSKIHIKMCGLSK